MSKDNYHKRPEWSYSRMKLILKSGIDYAVGDKLGLTPQPASKFIDLGELAHMLVLGGEDNFALSEFKDFRSKAAQEWRDQQLELGKTIISQDQFDEVTHIVKAIENHPHSNKFLLGNNTKHEQELYAKTKDGVALRGKADAITYHDAGKTPKYICDIKTTAKFDDFHRKAVFNDYDLQAAVYTLIAGTDLVNYYFCVAETVKPYRVKYWHANLEFLDSGERKLRRCIDEIIKFGDREPNFLYEEIGELGDYSL